MSKKTQVKKYLEAITMEEICSFNEKLNKSQKANRKKSQLKIEPVIPSVLNCLSLNMSSRRISKLLLEKHKLSISNDTILRFVKELKAKGYFS